jgi:hypothetical protein
MYFPYPFDIHNYHLEFLFELSISLCEVCQASKEEEQQGIVCGQTRDEISN